MFQFIRIGDSVFNTAHIISADYTPRQASRLPRPGKAEGLSTPARDAGYDADECEAYPARPSYLTLTTAGVKWERDESAYDGTFMGIGQKSDSYTFRGEQADALWHWLQRHADDVLTFHRQMSELNHPIEA